MRVLRKLGRDSRGATLVEFAFAAPVLVLAIMGLLDLCYRQYANAILQGSIQQAARDATLETGGTNVATIDGKVRTLYRKINASLPDSAFAFTRRNFQDFTKADAKEASTGPGGLCASGFTYVDTNNSSSWDDGALDGQGGAQDVVVYSVAVTQPNMFPIAKAYTGSSTQVIKASTILRNQPFGEQSTRTAGPTRNCPA